jgi:hypothetical protein
MLVALLLVALATACGPPRVIRLKTGQGAPLEYRPPTCDRSVTVDADDFEGALAQLVLEMPLALHAPEPGWLVRTSTSSTRETDRQVQRLLRKSFGGMCRPGQPREDCLSLLDDGWGLSPTDKLAVALGLSFGPMRESIAEAVKDTLAPQLFYAVALTGVVTWVILAANPEPVFTKSLAIVSAVMLIYLGVDGFLELLKASVVLKEATDRANTYEELEAAGERFGKQVGSETARVVILAITVVVSRGMVGGASGLASRLSMLPHFPQAAGVGASQLNLRLAAADQVSAIAVVEGNLVISLAPTAVAMAARGTGGADQGAQASSSTESLGELKWGNPLSKPTYGHTFLDHTSKLSPTQLTDRARSLGHQVGQWTDDKAAAAFIADVAKRGPGVHDVPLPKGWGRSFLADGTDLTTDMARVVVKSNGAVRTAFPYNSAYLN